MAKHKITLTDQQINTIYGSLRYDYVTTKQAFGALPIGVEMQEEIEDAYKAIKKQAPSA